MRYESNNGIVIAFLEEDGDAGCGGVRENENLLSSLPFAIADPKLLIRDVKYWTSHFFR